MRAFQQAKGLTVDGIIGPRTWTALMAYLGTITPPVPEPGYIIYVVQPGDTLYDLARRFGTTVDAIVAANDIQDPNLIYVGQMLRIPVTFPWPYSEN